MFDCHIKGKLVFSVAMDFLENFEPLLRTFWFVAIPASLIFLGQTVLTFIGLDASDGLDADFDGDFDGGDAPFQIFSFRNLINFLLGFSWTGISFYNTIDNKSLLIVLAFIVGLVFVYLFFLIIKQVTNLSEDNSFSFNSTIDKVGEVYLNIPEHMSGKGKVMISVNGSTRELDAMTEYERIPAGTPVTVVRVERDSILIVEKI